LEKLTFYSEVNHPRFDYTLGVFFGQLLGINTIRVQSPTEAHFNYSREPGGAIQMHPHGAMWNDHIEPVKVQMDNWNGFPAFFRTGNDLLPYDFLSAAFYLISRYEEYLSHDPDVHGRFQAESSILTQSGCLKLPVVHLWARHVGALLTEKTRLQPQLPTYKMTTTLDIDQLYKYRHKGLLRTLGGFVSDVFRWRKTKLKERIKTLSSDSDPFYNFSNHLKWHRGIEDVLYFFLMADHGKFDKNISHGHPQMVKTIQELEQQDAVRIGIHPGYQSNFQTEKIAIEKERLDQLLTHPTRLSRQHFLMMELPDTYERLEQLGIREDYSLGYSTHLGFRAGIGIPYRWFNLRTNQTSTLRINPFCYMDITPLHYLQWSPEQTMKFLKSWTDDLRQLGVHFQWLWHNESLSNSERWQGWLPVYHYGLDLHRKG
jgi:hypothetical protein